jgi:cell division protein FtsB
MLKKLNKMNKIMIVVFIAFVVWMLFFDENSYLIHRELNTEIEKLESSTDYYQKEIKKDQKMIKALNNPKSLEKFARETYRMKKKEEDIYIVEFEE